MTKFGEFSDDVAPWERVEVILGAAPGDKSDALTFALSDPDENDFVQVFVAIGKLKSMPPAKIMTDFQTALELVYTLDTNDETDMIVNLLFHGQGLEASFESFLKTWLSMDARFAVGVTRSKWSSLTCAFKILHPEFAYPKSAILPSFNFPRASQGFYPGLYDGNVAGESLSSEIVDDFTSSLKAPRVDNAKNLTLELEIAASSSSSTEKIEEADNDDDDETFELPFEDDDDGSADIIEWLSDDTELLEVEFYDSVEGIVNATSSATTVAAAAAAPSLVNITMATTVAVNVSAAVTAQNDSKKDFVGFVLNKIVQEVPSFIVADNGSVSGDHGHGAASKTLVSVLFPLALLCIIFLMIYKLGKLNNHYYRFFKKVLKCHAE